MTATLRPSRLWLVLVLVAFSGCTTFASLNSAARNLDAYELRPLPPQGPIRVGGRMVFVAEPSVSGALGSERTVVKPDALQVASLPDGRWVEPTSVHIRNLLARSLANSGRLGLVSTSTVGPLPDYTVMTDVETFQAEISSPTGAPARVVVAMTISIARDVDGRLVAAGRFARSADATGIDAPEIVAAFDAAMSALLHAATGWAVGVSDGGNPSCLTLLPDEPPARQSRLHRPGSIGRAARAHEDHRLPQEPPPPGHVLDDPGERPDLVDGKEASGFRSSVLKLGFDAVPVAILWYLEKIYIDDGLRKTGHLSLDGTPVDISRIRTPCFVLATKEESAAAQRPDSNILPLRGALRGGAAGEVVTALLSRGLIRQQVIDSTRTADSTLNTIWRNLEGGLGVLLLIAVDGLNALGIEPHGAKPRPP